MPRDTNSGRSKPSVPLSECDPSIAAPAGSRAPSIELWPIDDLQPYERNSRTHSDDQEEQLADSIDQFGMVGAIVIRNGVIGKGHGTLGGIRKLYAAGKLLYPMPGRHAGAEPYPAGVVPVLRADGWSDEQFRAFIIADNKLALNAGWNDEMLRLELADLNAAGFDMPLIGFDASELADLGIAEPLADLGSGGGGDSAVPINSAELAWRQWAGELATQIRALEAIGSARQGVTPGFALGAFLAALHDGEEYPRMAQSAFHPRLYSIAGNKESILQGLDRVASGDLDWKRLEFVCAGKMDVSKILGSPLPFAGARIAIDFPASLARDLIDEFAAGGSVCDPCHGWGGRLIGFMLSKAKYYAGTDPAPDTHRGVCQIRDTFAPHSGKEQGIELFNLPAEKWTPPTKDAGFNLVLTSPPYFDVEKYEGGEQSRLAHADYASWRDGFYAELIRRAHLWLRPSGIFALQVGSQAYPLLADGQALGKAAGFSIIEIRATDMTNNWRQTEEEQGEVVLLLRKKRR